MVRPFVVHVAQAEITEESGMGRVSWHWRREFERRGYDFTHIGDKQVGALPHAGLFPYAAFRAYKRLKRPATLLLIHEPSSGIFAERVPHMVVFSHGAERRGWELSLQGEDGALTKPRMRTRLLYPLWRLRQCDIGLRKASRLLLINKEDAAFAERYYGREPDDICVFKNGVYPSRLDEEHQPDVPTLLFLGSWLERKGIGTLVEAARILEEQSVNVNWILAGTGVGQETILSCLPEPVRRCVEVIPNFERESEEEIHARASLFVLPSYFEGQPLALLQAMEAGRCCITTNCCGQLDLIRHGFNGLLHEPGDAKGLAFHIRSCIQNEGLRLRLGKNAKRSVGGRSWEAVSSEVVDFIEELLP